MDLKGAYHQVGIVEDKKDIASIVTVDSQFVFNVMSFGLSVAPGIFEMFMEFGFKAIPERELSHYLDDCIIPSDTVEDMLERIANFLHNVVKFRIKLSPTKCVWFARTISFLGFILSERGIQKSPEYVQRIRDAPPPQTAHEMMKFLGLVNFHRRLVPGCSKVMAPLNNAIDRKAKNLKKTYINWTDEMRDAFKKIKELLVEDVTLAFPMTGEGSSELKLFVDASNISIGSALMQIQHGELRPISYVSKLLSGSELKYSAYDKEILGFVRGIHAHREYLTGRKFTVYTDCRNVVYLYKMKNSCPRLLRLLEQVVGYDFTIEHVAGIENYASDMMSRLTHYTDPQFHEKLVADVPPEYIPSDLMQVKLFGGADSPFQTISMLLQKIKGIEHEPQHLRKLLVEELIEKPEKYNAIQGPKEMDNLRSMLKPGVATYVVIFKVAAEMFRIKFYIYFGLEQPLVFGPVTKPNDNYPVAYVMCLSQGSHFNPLLDNKENFKPEIQFNEEGEELGRNYLIDIKKVTSDINNDIYDNYSKELKNELELEASEVLSVLSQLDNSNNSYNLLDNIIDSKCINLVESKTMNNQNMHRGMVCHSYQGTQTMTSSIESQTPKLFLRRYRDPHLCPNLHTLGDFCMKVSRTFRSNAVGGRKNNHGSMAQLCMGVDTGSSISLMTDTTHEILYEAGFAESAADLLGLDPDKNKICVLDGNVSAIGYATADFPFWFLGHSMRACHKFYILRDKDLPCCMLLGADFLKNLNISIICSETPKSNTLNYNHDNLKITSGRGYNFYLSPMFEEIRKKQTQLEKKAVIACVGKPLVHPPPECDLELNSESYPFSLDELKKLQCLDLEIRELKYAVRFRLKNKCPQQLKAIFDKFSFRAEVLVYCHSEDNPVPVLSRNFLITVASEIHEKYNHIGRAKLLILLQKFCWSPAMSFLVSNITKTCPMCQVNKPDTGKLAPPIMRREILLPYDLVCIDILTLTKTKRQNTCLLVIADHGSKWLSAIPLRNHAALTIINAMKHYISCSIRCPRAILSDNEASLVSQEFKSFCEQYDILRVYSAPYRPNTNGFSEKNCGLITAQLRNFANSNTDWDILMPQIVMNHNFSINSATNMTPSAFILEKAHVIDADNILPSEIESKWKMGNPNFCPFAIGNKVLYKIKYIGNRAVDKLKARYEGVYRIAKVNGSGLTYDIINIFDENYYKNNVHYSDLKAYHFPVKELQNSEGFSNLYMKWRRLAFGNDEESMEQAMKVEQDDHFVTQVQGLPGKVTTDPDVTPDPAKCGTRCHEEGLECARSDAGSDSSSEEDLVLFELNNYRLIFESAYAEYETAWDEWQNRFNNQMQSIIKIPKELFRVDYKKAILEFKDEFSNNPIYTMPLPSGALPDLGPPGQGVPLANRLVYCCENNLIMNEFNFEIMKACYEAEMRERYREIYALTINYNLRYYIDNKITTFNSSPNNLIANQVDINNASITNSDRKSSQLINNQSTRDNNVANHVVSEPANVETVIAGNNIERKKETPKSRKSLIDQLSPLQEQVNETFVSETLENSQYFAILNENKQLKNRIQVLEYEILALKQVAFDLGEQVEILGNSHSSSIFCPSLNSSLRDSSRSGIAAGGRSRTENQSSDSLGSAPDPEHVIEMIDTELTRLDTYEKEKSKYLNSSKTNNVSNANSVQSASHKSFIQFVQTGSYFDDIQINPSINDWTVQQQTIVNDTAMTTLNNTGLQEHLNNNSKILSSTLINNTLTNNNNNIRMNQSLSLLQEEGSDTDETLTPQKSTFIDPNFLNASTNSPYRLEVAAPLENIHRLVEISTAPEGDTVHPRGVRFSMPARVTRPKCVTCGQTSGQSCVCYIDNPVIARQRRYKDGLR